MSKQHEQRAWLAVCRCQEGSSFEKKAILDPLQLGAIGFCGTLDLEKHHHSLGIFWSRDHDSPLCQQLVDAIELEVS